MKFLVDRDVILKEMLVAQEIIATKNAISILSNVLLTAESNMLTIRATDIKTNFETRVPVEVVEEGSTTVFCEKFINILSSLPLGEVDFSQADANVTIKPAAKKIKFQLKCMASEKFPEVSFGESINYLEVSAKDFKEMIQQTIFAVSTDDTRIFMNGVYVEKVGDKFIMVATDGRRLSYVSREIFQGAPEFPSAIVPTKILTILLKRASSEGNLFLAIENNQVYFKFGSYQFASVLIEGKFPDYRRVIPEGQDKSFEIDKGDFVDALKRVGILVEQKTRKVLCEIKPGSLIFQASESELGSADEEIPCDYDGPVTTIGFNYTYLDEPLKVVNTNRIRFEFTESMKPVMLKPVPEGDYFHVIMPMQAD